jgi:hypothetical protein
LTKDPDPAPDAALFVSDLQDANIKINFFPLSIYQYPFLGTFTSLLKYKKSTRSHKTVEIKISRHLFACLMEGSGSGAGQIN